MIYEWFAYFVNTGVTASVVIGLVMVVRAFMGRFPKKYSYILWGIVLLRVLCPAALTSSVSVFNLLGEQWGAVRVYEQEAEGSPASGREESAEGHSVSSVSGEMTEYTESAPKAEPAGDAVVEPSGEEYGYGGYQAADVTEGDVAGQKNGAESWKNSEVQEGKPGISQTAQVQPQPFIRYGAIVWVCGAVLLFGWNVLLLIAMKRKVRTSVLLRDHIYECNAIPTPFVMGFVNPRIYMPFRLTEEEQEYVIRHEQYHIARKDNFVKLVAFGILCLYWFCPLFWVAYFFMGRDMEMSCDEYVLSHSDGDIRADYCRLLLGFATNRRGIGIGLTSFGESDTRRRVKHIMECKKFGKWIGLVAVVLILATGAICLTNAKPGNRQTEENSGLEKAENDSGPEAEDDIQEGKSKSGKELLTGAHEVAAKTAIYGYQVEVQCFSDAKDKSKKDENEQDQNYLSGDRLMIQTSRDGQVIDVCEADFEMDEKVYFPKDGFQISVSDYDGDGEENDFALGQGQIREPLAGNFMKYRFFGIGDDGMITAYHLSGTGKESYCIVTHPGDGDYSPVFERKRGAVRYTGPGKSGVKTKMVSMVKYLTVAEAESAGQEPEHSRMEGIRKNMPAEVVQELEQHGVWHISYGDTPEQRDANLANAEENDKVTLRLDFHYENGKVTKYTSKDYGFMANVPDSPGDGKQAAFRFAWDFIDFTGKEDDTMTKAELPVRWSEEEYTYYEDMWGATYLVDSRHGMVADYEAREEKEYGDTDLMRCNQVYGLLVSLPAQATGFSGVYDPGVDKKSIPYVEYVYRNKSLEKTALNPSVSLRCSESAEGVLEQENMFSQNPMQKTDSMDIYKDKKGTEYLVYSWTKEGVYFWLYTEIGKGRTGASLTDDVKAMLAEDAAKIAERTKRK